VLCTVLGDLDLPQESRVFLDRRRSISGKIVCWDVIVARYNFTLKNRPGRKR
jgi:hypothetical protein